MRYIITHIGTIIETYNGSLPLAHFLKNYFKQHPILGSRDRRVLSEMSYCWYRSVKGIKDQSLSMEAKLAACLKICGSEIKFPFSTENSLPQLPENQSFDTAALFPYDLPLSDGITKIDWLQSMLVQPCLFIRIRKDKGKVISLLNAAQIPFTFVSDNCLSLPNGAKIDTILPLDCYVVQDASSQQTGDFFKPRKNELWYDCCSGAGGKSLLLKDIEAGVRLTVTDRRESIIYNLQQRFRQYRYEPPVSHITDVSNPELLTKSLGTKKFDAIICDAPCSGSGTWSRTPEQLYFFKPESIPDFPALQHKIAVNVARHLKPGGRLFYITCSVFRTENEDIVTKIIADTGLQPVQSKLINGISNHADSMFIAELISSE